MKKKILIVTSDYYHPLRHRLHNMIEPLASTFDIHIITISPRINRNSKKNRIISIKNEQSDVKLTTIRIIRIPGFTFLLQYYKIRKIIKKQKFAGCLAIGPYSGFATLIVNPKCPVIYEDTDRFEYFADNFLSKFITRNIERYCIKTASHVISVGYSLAESARQIRMDYNVSCIPNGVDNSFLYQFNDNEKQKERENILIYIGTISKWSGLDLVIRSLPIIIEYVPDIKLVVVGDGDYMNDLKKLSKILELEGYIDFLGKKEYSDIPKILSLCKIGLAVYPKIDLMKYAFTLKLIEYMASGLAVITTAIGDGEKIVRESNCGIIVDYSPESFSNAIINLLKDEPLRYLISKNGIKYANNFNWSCLIKEEISVLNNVIGD